MAQYKFERYLKYSGDSIYYKPLPAGTPAPRSGIYRCDGCGLEVTALTAQPLPDKDHHPHAASQKLVRWKLIVADGGQPAPEATQTFGVNAVSRPAQH